MINDSEIRQAKFKISDLETQKIKAEKLVLSLGQQIKTAEGNLDQLERQQRREKDLAAAEKRRAVEQKRLQDQRAKRNPHERFDLPKAA